MRAAFLTIPSKFYGRPGWTFFKGRDAVGLWDDSALFTASGPITKVRSILLDLRTGSG